MKPGHFVLKNKSQWSPVLFWCFPVYGQNILLLCSIGEKSCMFGDDDRILLTVCDSLFGSPRSTSPAGDTPHHHVLHSPGGLCGEFPFGIIQWTNSRAANVCCSLICKWMCWHSRCIKTHPVSLSFKSAVFAECLDWAKQGIEWMYTLRNEFFCEPTTSLSALSVNQALDFQVSLWIPVTKSKVSIATIYL